MTYGEWMAARQLLAEQTVGVHLRAAQHREDEAFRKATKNLQTMK